MFLVISRWVAHFDLVRQFLSAWSVPELYYAPDFSGVMKLNSRPVLTYVRSQTFKNRQIGIFGSYKSGRKPEVSFPL